jgi:hypothetical protein
MSVVGGDAENICSVRVFRSLTHMRHDPSHLTGQIMIRSMSLFGTTPTALVRRMRCAIGGEGDIPATQRFFVQDQHAQGDRHLYASRTRFIPEKLLGLFERTKWLVISADTAARAASQGPKLDISARKREMWR